MALLDLKSITNIKITLHELSPIRTFTYNLVLMCPQIFFSGISLDAHLFYVEDITLHTQLELLHLTGQTPRSHEHVNSTQSFTRDMEHVRTVLTKVDWKRWLLSQVYQKEKIKATADVEFNIVLILLGLEG